jgi:hypothetical protein
MKEMKKLLLVIAALTLSVSAANATILWDQSVVDPANTYMDSYSIGPWGDVIVYGACDFNLGAPATITSVTTWYTAGGEWVDGTYDVLVDVFAKTASTPVTGVDDPVATGVTVSGTLTTVGDGTMALTVTGLNISLAAGDYWIMASPTVPDGPGFREFHVAAADQIMDFSAWIEYGGWMTPSWGARSVDGSILIEGDAVVATESVSFGGVKSLYR